ncbi:MAG TPA: poly-gamma-glutamate synthase PgsB [Syntrophales bacterium]|nr:poly-gamma-glutamate synthase PgsB [Syntrophales bacterium]
MLFFILLLVVFIFLVSEKIGHERRLKRIPIRIHVNGTRGKSNVTRLVAAALRRSGVRTLGKTTGTAPRLIMPDGSERVIRRWGPANILEQIKTVRVADQLKAEAIVIECMALDAALQFVSETKMIRATIGVITNVRPDHFEVMGETLDDIAEALSGTIPENGTLITGDSRYASFFAEVASGKSTRAGLAEGDDTAAAASPQGRFLFPENIAIARAVVSLLGRDPAAVSACLEEALIQRESAGVSRVSIGKREVHFVDAFSANDVCSTRIIEEKALASLRCPGPRVALFNNRADRPLRMKTFAASLLADPLYDYVAVIGECRRLAGRFIRRETPDGQIFILDGSTPAGMLSELFAKIPDREFTIVGMGNEKGAGRLVAEYLGEASLR